MSTSVHNQNTAVSKTARRLRKLLRELMNVIRHLTFLIVLHNVTNVTNVLHCVFIATLIVSLTLAEIGAGYPSRGTATVPSATMRSAAAAAGNDFHQVLWSNNPIPPYWGRYVVYHLPAKIAYVDIWWIMLICSLPDHGL